MRLRIVLPLLFCISELPLAVGFEAFANSLDRIDAASIQNRDDETDTSDEGTGAEGLDRASEVYVGIGFDSNRDGQSPPEASHFERFEAFHEFTFDTKEFESALSLNFNSIKYNELELARNRFDFEAKLETSIFLTDDDEIRFSSSYLRDWQSFSRADVYETQIYSRHASDQQRAWVKINSYTQLDKGNEEEVAADEELPLDSEIDDSQDEDDAFDLERTEPPDYTKLSAQAGYIPRPSDPLTVFLIGGLARAAFFNQGEEPAFDRRANEAYVIGGVRINIGRDFRIDAGWRGNFRDFADVEVDRDSTSGPDVRLNWTPMPGVTITGKVERAYEETTSVFAIVDDVQTQSLMLELEPSDKLRISLEASHEIERPVEDIVRFEQYEVEAIATYTLTPEVELFGEALAKLVEEKAFDESVERYRIEGGVRLRY